MLFLTEQRSQDVTIPLKHPASIVRCLVGKHTCRRLPAMTNVYCTESLQGAAKHGYRMQVLL